MAAEAAVRLNAWARTRSNRGLGDPRHEPTFFIDAHPADWKTHGKAAGRIRNVEMLELGPTIVLAFLMNGSRGTMHTITEAANRDYPIIVVAPDGTTRQNFPFQSF